MSTQRTDKPPRPGLRERKKAKTRALIQEHALRLFRERGYEATSIEEIADAAEVSSSTFFRYFPTKEDVVLYDAFDPIVIEAFRSQPSELGPIAALRAAMRSALAAADTDWAAQMQERADLLLSVSDLRRAMLDSMVTSMEPFAEALADRVGRRPDDFAVRNTVGAVIGVGLYAWFNARGDTKDYAAQMDAALAHLDDGLPL